GDLGVSHDYSRKTSQSEFHEWYVRTKQFNASNTEFDYSSESSRTSSFASYIRDAASIQAWQACVTSDAQPGLYAFGSRDAAGNPSMNVVWAPGTFGGIAPRVTVSFAAASGTTVDAPSTVEIAIGSGRAFALHASNDAKGFDVFANGTIFDESGHPLASFTSE